MKNNNKGSMLTRKAKAGNEGKISPLTRNGFSDKAISKKIKKNKNTQQSDSESNLNNMTDNSENFQTACNE